MFRFSYPLQSRLVSFPLNYEGRSTMYELKNPGFLRVFLLDGQEIVKLTRQSLNSSFVIRNSSFPFILLLKSYFIFVCLVVIAHSVEYIEGFSDCLGVFLHYFCPGLLCAFRSFPDVVVGCILSLAFVHL